MEDTTYVVAVDRQGKRTMTWAVARTKPDRHVTLLVSPRAPWSISATLLWIAQRMDSWYTATPSGSTSDRGEWALHYNSNGVLWHIDRHTCVAGDLTSVIFYVWRWRRATGFCVIQRSAQRMRALLYLGDRVRHTGAGTSVHNAVQSPDDLRRLVADALNEAWSVHGAGDSVAARVLHDAWQRMQENRLPFGVDG